VELFPGFQDDCWFSTGHFADVMMGFGHDAEASSCFAFYSAQCSFVYRTFKKLKSVYIVSRRIIPSVELRYKTDYQNPLLLKMEFDKGMH
jgi:hypothetical protein